MSTNDCLQCYYPKGFSVLQEPEVFLFLSVAYSLCNRCFECNEELSTHCNKKALAQSLDFLQKHSVKATSGKVQKKTRLPTAAAEVKLLLRLGLHKLII